MVDTKNIEFLVFQVGEISCGISILEIEGINWIPAVTPVYGASDHIKGLLNLRGQLVTVFDLGKRLGLETCQMSKMSRIIIIKLNQEYIGLLVDSVTEVVSTQKKFIEPPPANTDKFQGAFFCGIIKVENRLTTILNVEEILKVS